MQVFNRSAISKEFSLAFDAVMAGGTAKRSGWPEGQYIALCPGHTDQIAVFRGNRLSAPAWHASNEEVNAPDWQFTTPQGESHGKD